MHCVCSTKIINCSGKFSPFIYFHFVPMIHCVRYIRMVISLIFSLFVPVYTVWVHVQHKYIYFGWRQTQKIKYIFFFHLHFTCFCAELKRTASEPAMRTALNSHTSHIRVHKYFSHVDDDCIHFSHSCFGRYGTKRKCKYGKVIKNGTTSDENNVRCSCCCCLRI